MTNCIPEKGGFTVFTFNLQSGHEQKVEARLQLSAIIFS